MSTYLIGDIHGCFNELQGILNQICFDPLTDTLWLTGDLVDRGPDSIKVLRLVYKMRNNIKMVLGNHDLNLLRLYASADKNVKNDYIMTILKDPNVDKLINWLRYQPVLQVDERKKLIMVHAGITPQWDIFTAFQYAQEIKKILISDNYLLYLNSMYENIPNDWTSNLNNFLRIMFSIKVFTRIRYCLYNGQLEMTCKTTPDKAPSSFYPWFSLFGFVSEKYSIVFGHWSSLMGKYTPPGIYGLDTGCCWGGTLTLLRWEDKHIIHYPSETRKSYI